MATNINWFVIWVPSYQAERESKSKSKSRSKFEITKIGEEEEMTGGGVGGGDGDGDVDNLDLEQSVETEQTEESSTQSTPLTPEARETEEDKETSKLIEECETKEKRSEMTVTSESDVFLKWESLEDIVKRVISERKITNLHIVSSTDQQQTQFSFSVQFEEVEDLVIDLQNNGLGQLENTSLSVFPSSIHVSEDTRLKPEKTESVMEEKMDKFYSSIKSRLLVSEVIARIRAGAEFSFDFLLLLLLSGIIAFFGLMENSSVVLVASMLVSPLMGPILAGIFGGAVHDKSLAWCGVRHEVYSLMICILLGFVLGLPLVPWLAQYYNHGVETADYQFPTSEMLARGELRSLWVGSLIAIPSGAGVALSVLGGKSSQDLFSY